MHAGRSAAGPDLLGLAEPWLIGRRSFEALRPRMIRLAYGVLGSRAEAEDVVQDAWLRLQRSDAEIRDLVPG